MDSKEKPKGTITFTGDGCITGDACIYVDGKKLPMSEESDKIFILAEKEMDKLAGDSNSSISFIC